MYIVDSCEYFGYDILLDCDFWDLELGCSISIIERFVISVGNLKKTIEK